MSIAAPRAPLFAPDWLVGPPYEDEALGIVKAGKESEVTLIARRGTDRTSYLAEKRFKGRGFRAFGDDAAYRETWFAGPGASRARRAVRRGTRKGREIVEGAWVSHEWNELVRLYDAGVTVPLPVEEVEPTARRSATTRVLEAEGGYRMAFVGEPPRAAPRLAEVRLVPREAEPIWRACLAEVAAMLAVDRVHGDLSAYNVLYWRERVVLIDLSQAVDTVTHPGARDLLRRDLDALASYFRRAGFAADVDRAWEEIDADRLLSGRRW